MDSKNKKNPPSRSSRPSRVFAFKIKKRPSRIFAFKKTSKNSPNIRLVIAYDGTRYCGWQKVSPGASIEGCLEAALQTILQSPVVLQATSRTDAGVHAEGQVVNFLCPKPEIDCSRLQRSLNGLLPDDIVVKGVEITSQDFHPTLDCTGKHYRYRICMGQVQLPHFRHISWHVEGPLDLAAMETAAQKLIGEHDFAAFCNSKNNESYDSTVRRVDILKIEKFSEKMLQIDVEGPNFLYKMVRNLIGMLVYVGLGKIGVEEVVGILQSKDRRRGGITAPAHGLTLWEVFYSSDDPIRFDRARHDHVGVFASDDKAGHHS